MGVVVRLPAKVVFTQEMIFPLKICSRTEGRLWHRLSHGGQHLHRWQDHVHICHWWRGQ